MMADKPATPPRLTIAAGEVVLALDCLDLLAPGGPLPLPGTIHRGYGEIDAALLAGLQPERIILPLFASGYDAMSAIEALQRLGYAGLITVVAPELPRPRLVERELRAAGPGQRLSLITL